MYGNDPLMTEESFDEKTQKLFYQRNRQYFLLTDICSEDNISSFTDNC